MTKNKQNFLQQKNPLLNSTMGNIFLYINTYFKDHLAVFLQYRRGFLCLIHLKPKKQTSFPLFVKNAYLYAFCVLNQIEVIFYHQEVSHNYNLCFYFCALFSQTKTGIALLYDEVSENAYDIRLKLTKEVLTIQKQDVVCVSGSDHSANVSASRFLCF